MNEKQFLVEYFERYQQSIFATDVNEQLIELKELVSRVHADGKKVIIAGNGGSAAIASHCAVDFTKNAHIRCVNFNEVGLVTCLANDYGYENVYSRSLATLAQANDLLIAVSSSGKSKNIRNATDCMKEVGGKVITLSGFDKDNPLRAMGSINFWLNSNDYGLVEIGHMFFLHCLADHLKQ